MNTFERGDRVVVVADSENPEYVGQEGRIAGMDVGLVRHVGEAQPRMVYNVVLDGRPDWDYDGFYGGQLELAGAQRVAA